MKMSLYLRMNSKNYNTIEFLSWMVNYEKQLVIIEAVLVILTKKWN
jgi:hypothetical protein